MIDRVIKGLTCRLECGCMDEDHCNPECPYLGEPRACRGLDEDALALLKKQKPMRAITSEVQYGDHLRHCPWCGKALPNSGEYGKSNYCYKCGQEVKWE